MRTSHRRSALAGRRPHRKLVWATTQTVITALASGQNSVTDLLVPFSGVAGATTLGITIMRIHLTGVVPAANLADSTTFGISVGRTEDIGVGLNQRPEPLNEPELDWMINSKWYASASGATVDSQRVINLDLRSKRKMDELGQRLLLSVHNGNAAAATYGFYSRVLVALP